jgi:hypothetical protein
MILAFAVLLLVALGGALTFELAGQHLKHRLPLVLAFGGAYLIGLIFLHLVPEAYAHEGQIGWYVLAGFLLQVVLEWMSKGIEHGHVHLPSGSNKAMPWGVYISLCLHALIESMPLTEAGGHAHHDHHHHVHAAHLVWEQINAQLLLGLGLHKFPVALVLMGLLAALGMSTMKRWTMLLVFGSMPLLGMGAYELLVHSGAAWATLVPSVTEGLLIGILLHIATTILFETGDGHRFNLAKLAVTVVGLAVAAISLGLA